MSHLSERNFTYAATATFLSGAGLASAHLIERFTEYDNAPKLLAGAALIAYAVALGFWKEEERDREVEKQMNYFNNQ